jgi:hypothetical protein
MELIGGGIIIMNMFFEELENAQSPYVDMEINEKVKNSLFARLGNVKEFVFASEDGEFPCTAKHFMEILNDYRFQNEEISKMQKGDIWLFAGDGDYYVVAKF